MVDVCRDSGRGRFTACDVAPNEGVDGDGKLSDVGEARERPGGEGNWRVEAGGGGGGGGFIKVILGGWP